MQTSKLFVVLGFAASTAFAGSAIAQRVPDASFYVGGSLGQSEARDWCSSVPGFVVTSCDDKDTGWKLFAGYQMNRNFAVEASYMDFGDFSARVNNLPVTSEATSWGIAGVGILPLTPQFSAFGKVGFAQTEVDASVAGFGFSGDETELHYGLGVLWNFNPNLAVRAEWERLNKTEIDMLSVGVQFRF